MGRTRKNDNIKHKSNSIIWQQKKVDILQVNTEPSRTSVKDLRKELKSLKMN